MFKKISGIMLLALILSVALVNFPLKTVKGAQEIKELGLISKFLEENFNGIKRIHRLSHEMKGQARPFTVKRHRERYRFEPGDRIPREIMSLSRKIAANYKMIQGILHQADVANKGQIFRDMLEGSENIATFCKRAIRANKDYNYALYLASAQGVEKEIIIANDLLNDLELAINRCVSESDAKKENL